MLSGKRTRYQYFNNFTSVFFNFLYDASYIIIRNQIISPTLYFETLYISYFRSFLINILAVFHYEVLKKNTWQYVETCVYISSEDFGKGFWVKQLLLHNS